MSVTPSVSVVIAVYKVEEYIAQCCHSLFAQTLKNIEYIFVDDCSPDKSMDIVQSVLAEYPDRGGQVKSSDIRITWASAEPVKTA